MLKNWWSVLGFSPLVLSCISGIDVKAIASEIEPKSSNINSNPEENLLQQLEPLEQINSVSQLRDVSPTDWAYEALRGLTDRYGCIAGFPNQTYRGSQALSRYEFAAGLNSCLNQIERLIASSEAVVREDIDTIDRFYNQAIAD